MSELQIALLSIGIGVVVAVYFYGWWQQRQYRRKFGSAFKAEHEDVLYQEHGSKPTALELDEPTVLHSNQPSTTMDVPVSGIEGIIVLDESCALLDARSDFVIELQLDDPAPAVVLDGLWQRKFDFGKPLYVCGVSLNSGQWERVIAESQTLYLRLRVALQLVDRGGVVSATRLSDFRDLVLNIAKLAKADATIPNLHETHQHALELDALCAEVDQMVGLNLLPSNGRLLRAENVSHAATMLSMTLEADGAFHRLNKQGQSLFSLSNLDSKPFQHHTLETSSSNGVTFLLDVPRVEQPANQFDEMMKAAEQVAAELQLNVVDDRQALLSDVGLSRIRTQIMAVEAQMLSSGIVPGSAQARRLFS